MALMAGATTAHYFSVDQTVTLAHLGLAKPAIESPAAMPAAKPGSSPTATLAAISELRRQNEMLQASLDSPESAAADPLTQAAAGGDFHAQLLKELVSQNRQLRDQVAETNRDLMELQFRVDTHSESFRPLNMMAEEASPYDTSIGVLPPRDIP